MDVVAFGQLKYALTIVLCHVLSTFSQSLGHAHEGHNSKDRLFAESYKNINMLMLMSFVFKIYLCRFLSIKQI